MTHPDALRRFNVEIYFPEGSPEGLRLVYKSNWSGLGIVCPRNRYAEAKKRSEFSRSGVYLLIGRNEEDNQEIYIGESETIRDRLDQHHAKKDFWQKAIIFTKDGSPLHKAQVQYLESHLVQLAKRNKNWGLGNNTEPKEPKLSESEEAKVAAYLADVLLILPVLGVDAFVIGAESGEKSQAPPLPQITPYLYFWKGKGWNATGYETSNGFMVQEGSEARLQTTTSMHSSPSNKRDLLIENKVLIRESDHFRFAFNYLFDSPSQAASVCAGSSCSGPVSWKDEKGVTLKNNRKKEAGSKSK